MEKHSGKANEKSLRIYDNDGRLYSVNFTMSFGVQPMILHSFSKVSSVMFLFFFRESKVLLSIPAFRSLYWVMPRSSMVSHIGSKLIMVITA